MAENEIFIKREAINKIVEKCFYKNRHFFATYIVGILYTRRFTWENDVFIFRIRFRRRNIKGHFFSASEKVNAASKRATMAAVAAAAAIFGFIEEGIA